MLEQALIFLFGVFALLVFLTILAIKVGLMLILMLLANEALMIIREKRKQKGEGKNE